MKFSLMIIVLGTLFSATAIAGSSSSVTSGEGSALAQKDDQMSSKKPLGTIVNKQSFSRDWVLGSLLKQSLEAMHFSKKNTKNVTKFKIIS